MESHNSLIYSLDFPKSLIFNTFLWFDNFEIPASLVSSVQRHRMNVETAYM
jgi:hypothetical protein